GRIEIYGSDRILFVDRLTTNDVTKLKEFQVQYSTMCLPNGGIIDDLLVYNLPTHILLVVNGARCNRDLQWITENKKGDVEIIDRTSEIAQLAIQGPKAEQVMQKLCSINLGAIDYYRSAFVTIDNIKVLISRTGYTGEDGFEIYVDNDFALRIWDMIFDAGREFGIEPIGLGARDTLRLEMKYCLYGSDITEDTTPLEAGLNFIVKLDKANTFIGQEALRKIKLEGPKRKLIGFEMIDSMIPRSQYYILVNGIEAGKVTSGNWGPSVQKGIGMGYVPTEFSVIGTELEIVCRGKLAKAKIVSTPFYKSGSRK
ncbi:MAG: glycine cleavage system aminomethyltransferase GcvT, partial [candidate division WOR-3 bacterium]|nr:glycine cleavage system aminomethyltransferase GcvT [candidate division WOR-3 bacterium]